MPVFSLPDGSGDNNGVKNMAKAQKKAAPKAKTTAAAKPSVENYGFRSNWKGPSDVTNARVSRTKIDPTKFNAYPNGTVTERDQDAMVALRGQFGGKEFERRNVDAGILRRLMERGLAKNCGPECNAPTAKFKLTSAGQGKFAATA